MTPFRSKLAWFVVGASATLAFFACADDGEGQPAGGLAGKNVRVLARNILLGASGGTASGVRTASAEGELDTTTKLPASNVVYEQSVNADLSATNVQSALEELAVKLDTVLPGTWNIQNSNQEDLHAPAGVVTFGADGTFNLAAGSFAAIGMGSSGFCNHTGASTFQLLSPRTALFLHTNQTAANSAVPTLVDARPDRLVFVGTGGCGELGRPRVSILTRQVDGGAAPPTNTTPPAAGTGTTPGKETPPPGKEPPPGGTDAGIK